MVALCTTLISPSRKAGLCLLEVALPHVYAGNEKIHDIPTSISCQKYILSKRKSKSQDSSVVRASDF